MNQRLPLKGEGKRTLAERSWESSIKQNYLTGKVVGNLLKGEGIIVVECCCFFLFILHKFDQWGNTMAQNGEDNNGNRSDRQMAPVSSQFCKQMFFSAGYSISLPPGTPKREYKDSLGRVETLCINCWKYCTALPTGAHGRGQIFRAVICSPLYISVIFRTK